MISCPMIAFSDSRWKGLPAQKSGVSQEPVPQQSIRPLSPLEVYVAETRKLGFTNQQQAEVLETTIKTSTALFTSALAQPVVDVNWRVYFRGQPIGQAIREVSHRPFASIPGMFATTLLYNSCMFALQPKVEEILNANGVKHAHPLSYGLSSMVSGVVAHPFDTYAKLCGTGKISALKDLKQFHWSRFAKGIQASALRQGVVLTISFATAERIHQLSRTIADENSLLNYCVSLGAGYAIGSFGASPLYHIEMGGKTEGLSFVPAAKKVFSPKPGLYIVQDTMFQRLLYGAKFVGTEMAEHARSPRLLTQGWRGFGPGLALLIMRGSLLGLASRSTQSLGLDKALEAEQKKQG